MSICTRTLGIGIRVSGWLSVLTAVRLLRQHKGLRVPLVPLLLQGDHL